MLNSCSTFYLQCEKTESSAARSSKTDTCARQKRHLFPIKTFYKPFAEAASFLHKLKVKKNEIK